MSDAAALVQFKAGWERDGTGEDGLPIYRSTIIIRLDRPPYLSVERTASEEDFADHPLPFQLFQKEQAARKQSYSEGYPLSLWPAVGEAEFKMLVDRDITTVEQLAGLHKKHSTMPSELRDLAERASKLMALQKGAPKFEELLKDRDGKIEALTEQVKDAMITIATQKSELDRLRVRLAV